MSEARRRLVAELDSWGWPGEAMAGRVGRALGTSERLAAALGCIVHAPNTAATTFVPVDASGTPDVLLSRYAEAGLLRRSGGRWYARFRDPSRAGDNVLHNRCLGFGSAVAKGTGLTRPVRLTLGPGASVDVVVSYDRKQLPDQRLRGAMSAGEAEALHGLSYRSLSARLEGLLDTSAAAQHRLNAAIIPRDIATLRLDAIPVAPRGRGLPARWQAAAVRVAPWLKRRSPGVVWLSVPGFLELLHHCQRAPKREQPLYLQCYTARHAVFRAGDVLGPDGKRAHRIPALAWDTPLAFERAAFVIACWSPIFADYDLKLEHDARSGRLSVRRRSGGAHVPSARAALQIAEGSALINGLLLRCLWELDLGVGVEVGGNPFMARNSNPRSRVDWDTLGPYGAPRAHRGGARLDRRRSRAEDLRPAEGGGAEPHLANTARLLGLEPDRVPALRRTMLAAARGQLPQRLKSMPVKVPSLR